MDSLSMSESPTTEMSVAVVIASTGRPEILDQTLNIVFEGSRVPDEIVVALAQESDLPEDSRNRARAAVYVSPKGLTKQRNFGLSKLRQTHDIVIFVDDDLFVHEDYVENIARNFHDNPELVLIMGHILQNGDISPEDAIALLKKPVDHSRGCVITSARWGEVYGANMAFRSDFFDTHEFDERLPQYSHMEDVDIGTLARRHGKVGYSFDAVCVHLRTPSGRVNNVKLGFCEITNPVYLARKGTVPITAAVFQHCIKTSLTNLLKGVFLGNRVKRERLRGNLIAYSMILRGRIYPEHLEQM